MKFGVGPTVTFLHILCEHVLQINNLAFYPTNVRHTCTELVPK